MVRLLKLCIGLAAFVAFAYFGATVPLGSRTLFGHMRAIAETKESQELVDGTKHAAEPLVDGVRRRIAGKPAAPDPVAEKAPPKAPAAAPDAGAAPQEQVSPSEKRQLRRLLGRVERPGARRD
jgi:hypothetical protein